MPKSTDSENKRQLLHPGPGKISALDVYMDKRRSRIRVGRLEHISGIQGKQTKISEVSKIYRFTYDNNYLDYAKAIPLGPGLPLTERVFSSEHIFPEFLDRIPSKDNPAYVDYCKTAGISRDEDNLIVLLATIGRQGPSSFIFEAVYDSVFSGDDVRAFRKALGISIRDFASLFGFSYATIHSIENRKKQGKEAIKRLEIYQRFPEVALFEANKNLASLNEQVKIQVLEILLNKRANREK